MIPVKVNYNYFTLYKASSLNHKITWSKRVGFQVFLRCRIFLRRIHGSRLSAIVRSDSICFYWNGWMKNWLLLLMYKSCPVIYKSCQRESKINHYSWFLSRETSRLIKRIAKRETNCSYWKENNNLITALKPLSWNLCHVRPLSNVEFLMSAQHLFFYSDVRYDGAEFDSVCCNYSQSLGKLMHYIRHLWNATSKSNVEPKSIQRFSIWPNAKKFSWSIYCSFRIQECRFKFDTSYGND